MSILASDLYADSAQARLLDKRFEQQATGSSLNWQERDALARAESARLASVREEEHKAMRKRVAKACDAIALNLGMQPYQGDVR